MDSFDLADGDAVFRAGDRSTHAFRVEAGLVQVIVGHPPRVLAEYGPGEVFGEIGMLEGRLRRFGARACGDTRLVRLDTAEWASACVGDSGAALVYLRTLFRRVREVDEMLLRLPPETVAAEDRPLQVRLVPDSAEAQKALPAGDLPVTRFPFRIGRASHGSESSHAPPDLILADPAPHNVSRRHAALDRIAGRVVVADLGSSLGTQVNGVRIGGHHKESEIDLHVGRNELVLGGPRSPHRFVVLVEPA